MNNFTEVVLRKTKVKVHPYIPNSAPEVKQAMLKEIGIKKVDELYNEIPSKIRFKGKLNIPDGIESEFALKRHVETILAKNTSCVDNLSFLGGGVANHYVPVICDEVNSRAEFLTAYAGEPYEDHGRFQSLWEFQSLMAELLDVEVVSVPTFDGAQAASSSIGMIRRYTGRDEILISDTTSPDRLAVIQNYCHPMIKITMVKHNVKTGMMDIEDLKQKMTKNVAGIYFENPSYLGFIETEGKEISKIVHKNGGKVIVYADPISLGVLTPPSNYGADITCGEIQPLGLHINYGGATGGYIGVNDDPKLVQEYPWRLFGIDKTEVEGEWGFGDVLYDDRTSFGNRETGKDYVGTASALWGITAGVYLALMGPEGMKEVGTVIMQRSQYAAKKISGIKGIKAPAIDSPFFKEFIVDFNKTGKTVSQINKALEKKGIFGGKDLSKEFKELGQSALFCITEENTKEDIDRLVSELKNIIK
ncbi:MAG: aminomethyl-transferring glycine dehydrogenase subunit GcvPA [Bacteroidetes bacterium]|nr:aminomethyl-transferring glycine dehydrogenase subunit GcvPA [Bacteroidota bacterium]